MTHQVVAFARPMQTSRPHSAEVLPLSSADLGRGLDRAHVALSVALRYLSVRRRLRRTAVVRTIASND